MQDLAAAGAGHACRPPGTAGETVSVVAQRAETSATPPGTLVSGIIPPLADPYFERLETGPGLQSGLRSGQSVVLTDGDPAEGAPAAQGGTGKTQLAVEFAHALWNGKLVEVLVWVTASHRESIVSGFAQAANTVDASGPGEDAEAAAARFVSWLARTERPWALILDDLADVAELAGLWPEGPSGRTVITTRRPASEFADQDVRVVPVPGMNRRETLAYLSSRLTDHPDQRIKALDLGEDLDGLPLALAQATAVINARQQDCRDYREALAERRKHMSAVDGVSAMVLATWSLSSECAHDLPPAGLAWPTLALTAMMDHHGIPGAVLTSPAACTFIAGRPSTAGGADQNMVRAAINNLAAAGLLTIDPASAVRTVQMHASVQAAVRAWLPQADREQGTLAAADALLETWPDGEGVPQIEQALRDCTAALRANDGGMLWKTEAHPLLFRAGLSLEASGLSDAAITYWQSIVATATQLLGPAHANAVVARDRLAAAYESAGRSAEAISVFQAALADRERNQGPEHQETIAARGHLAHAYTSAGRPGDAVALYERTAADAERLLGPGHPTTLDARTGLAAAYADSGQDAEAIGQYERAVTDREWAHGRDHPDTIAARANLASAQRAAGNLAEAIGQYEQVLGDRERVQGADHPDTIAARANLAYAYRSADRLREAVPVYERTLADRERVQGADHRDTLTARSNLAACYQQARRLPEAIPQYERALADSERMLGPGDLGTLSTRCNLASAYYSTGRLFEAVAVLQRALADSDRYLGSGHPMTQTVRENLEAATQG